MAKLTKLISTHNNLRTDSMDGEYPFTPTIGRPFILIGEPLDHEFDHRMIYTSNVVSIIESSSDSITFKTANSTYRLDDLSNGGYIDGISK